MLDILRTSGEYTDGRVHTCGNIHFSGRIRPDGYSRHVGYIQKVLSYGSIAYWPLDETNGTIARCIVDHLQNGAYQGVTLGNGRAPDGSPCPYFDGASDYVNIWTTTFRDAFNPSEGTIGLWAMVESSGIWTDGLTHRAVVLQADINNRIYIDKSSTNNQLQWRYTAGGTSETRDNAGYTTTNWFHLAITWSAIADEVKTFYNGVQVGATMTTLGAWSGDLGATSTVIGAANTTPAVPWDGWLGHCFVLPYAAEPSQIRDAALV